MIVDETTDGNLEIDNPLAKGIVIFPENQEELKYIQYLLEDIDKIKDFFEINCKQKNYE